MGSLLFGEIVEPTTRALIDDDIEEYPDYIEIAPEWEGNTTVPTEINTLFVMETKTITEVVQKCVLLYEKPLCKIINGGVEIYALPKDQYLVLKISDKALGDGQVVESLNEWINVSKQIVSVTSDSIFKYQNIQNMERPASLVRILTNSDDTLPYTKLERPNLITGLGANILAFCIHNSMKKCTAIIIYLDKSPMDSFHYSAITEILKKLNLYIKTSSMIRSSESNNLYM